jgi:hypothetical protein
MAASWRIAAWKSSRRATVLEVRFSSPHAGGNPKPVSEDCRMAGQSCAAQTGLEHNDEQHMVSLAAPDPMPRASEPTGTTHSTRRFALAAGASGIAFVVLLVGPLFAFGLGPSPTAGPDAVARYYAEHAGVLQSIQVLRASSTLFFMVFLAGLANVLYRLTRSAAQATAVVAAGVTVAGINLVLYSARQAIALNAAQLQDPAVVQTIRDFSNALESFSGMPLAVLVACTSWGLSGNRGAGRWIGRAGLPVAVLLVLEGASAISALLKPLGATGLLLFSMWLAVLAIWLCVRPSPAD